MKKFDEIDAENYHSETIGNLLAMIKPEAQAQTDYRIGLAVKISKALKAKGWKNQDLAKALNIKSNSLISKWLSGTHNFTVDTLVLIQMALGIQLLNVGDEDNPNSTSPDNANQKSFATINYK